METKNKAIIILSGYSTGKNDFDRIAKEHGYWVWNTNSLNVLGKAARIMGWQGDERDDKYRRFIKEIEELANEYWNFDLNNILERISNFNESEKANLLVIHYCPAEFIEKICEEYEAIKVNIIKDSDTPQLGYDKTLVYNSDFVDNVLGTLRILVD